MSLLNQGRNEIRINNSGAKCLLENWVEERAVSNMDPSELKDGQSSAAELYKDGHRGLLTTQFDASADNLTTVRETYVPPRYPGVPVKGVKQALMERAFTEKAVEQMNKQINPEPVKAEYNTEFRDNFTKEFKSHRPLPTRPHDVVYEQPVTFWTEQRDKITGTTQIKTRDTVFRKNAAFSTPIEESWEKTRPYDIENVPKM